MMKKLRISITKLSAVLLLLIFQGCNGAQTEIDSNQEDIPGATLTAETKQIVAFNSGPVDREHTIEAKFIFDMSYSTPRHKLKYAPITIPIAHVQNFLSRTWTDNDTGFVFHYGYSLQTNSIQYIISPGKLIPGTPTGTVTAGPFPQGTSQTADYYVLLDPDLPNSHKIIYQDEFCALTKNYQDSIRLKSDLENFPVNHPQMIFHHGRELNQFLTDNTSYDLMHMHIIHGVADLNNNLYHAPYFIFGDNSGNPVLDDHDYGTIYGKKSLDIGHPCPTACHTTRNPLSLCD